LLPFSAGLWFVIATCAVVLAFAINICFQIALQHGKEQATGQKFGDWLFTTFGALFCSQGKNK
jgi:hypothetical protein